jgi:hypothetical protein
MAVTYPKYAGMSPKECDREALRLVRMAYVNAKWDDDLAERLMELRKVKRYAPLPAFAVKKDA